jgi:hypothetical protein
VRIRLLEARLRGALIEARFPFRFGIAEMKEIVHVLLFVTTDIDGKREIGVAADNLPPKWFTKNPESSYRDDVEEMIGVIQSASAIAVECGSTGSVFDLWHEVHSEQAARRAEVAPILAAFGVSLVERAAVDAFCRAKDISFAQAVRQNALGIRLGNLHAALARQEPHELLPQRPLPSLSIRHTVGLSDSLEAGEGTGALPADGLPATLDASIREYGLRRFKIKVSGDHRFDLDRLGRIGEVLDRETSGDYRVTLDGNEQFADVSALRVFWEDVRASHGTAELARRIDYVEQPLPRELALSTDMSAGLAAWTGRPKVIIDESDDSLDATARAIEAGYDGGSFKSSKGVFKGIGNACRIEQLRRERPGERFIYGAEDSSTIGPVGLLADLAVIATLGIDEPERNGHHYFRGLSGLPARAQEETLRHHGDLYSPHTDDAPALKIQEGRIDVGSVVAAPFGVGWRCDFEEELDTVDALVAAIT